MRKTPAALAAPEPAATSATLNGVALARLLGVSYRTLMRRPGDYPRPAFGAGKLRRWLKADVERWLADRSKEAARD